MADASDELDGQLAALVEDFEAEGLPPWHSLSVESARHLEDEVFAPSGDGPEMATVREFAIDGPGGELPIRAYVPHAEDPATLVFYHGGGWTLGTLDSCADICLELADRAGCVVCSVDYRLAPEHPFPAAVDDAWAALTWAATYADTVGGDPDRLGVAGTSAGGNLAAAVALRARDNPSIRNSTTRRERRGPSNRATATTGDGSAVSLDCQFLLYPITDCAFDTDSYREFGDGPLLSESDMRWFWANYCRSPVDSRHPYASVLRTDDLSDVVPAVVVTAGYDVLRDEGAAYANRLATAGVSVEHLHYSSLAHGFFSLTDTVDRADAAMDDLAALIRERLG